MKSKFGALIFFSLLVLGLFFRLWRIDRAPISLFGDEIDVGLQGYSILTTGNDYFGNRLPLMFHSFSEYRHPAQLYEVVPFIKLFGLNEFGVRGPAILSGIISIILIYFLTQELVNKKVAVFATIFLIFSPWHFNFSRQANDAGTLLPFILAGTLFFVKGLKDYKYILASAIFFAISVYSYAIATLFVPIFVLSLLAIYKSEIIKHGIGKMAAAGVIGLLILLPYLLFTIKGIAGRRFSDISIFAGDSIFQEVVDKRRWSTSPLTRLFYNTKSIGIDHGVKNYLMTFSSTFLFSKGDPNMRQGIEGFGQMYCFEMVFILFGLGYTFFGSSKNNKKNYLAILAWAIIAPIPSSLTKDGGYHASRLILMLPPLTIFSAIGFNFLKDKLYPGKTVFYKIIFLGILGLMLFDYTKFLHRYFVVWPNESWRFWQYGFKEAILYVKENEGDYSRVVMNSSYEPMLPRFLFYYKYDMSKFQSEFTDDKYQNNIIPGVNGFKLGEKYIFGELLKPIENLSDKSTLVVASGEKDVTNPDIFKGARLKLLYQNTSPTGIPIFYIFSE